MSSPLRDTFPCPLAEPRRWFMLVAVFLGEVFLESAPSRTMIASRCLLFLLLGPFGFLTEVQRPQSSRVAPVGVVDCLRARPSSFFLSLTESPSSQNTHSFLKGLVEIAFFFGRPNPPCPLFSPPPIPTLCSFTNQVSCFLLAGVWFHCFSLFFKMA